MKMQLKYLCEFRSRIKYLYIITFAIILLLFNYLYITLYKIITVKNYVFIIMEIFNIKILIVILLVIFSEYKKMYIILSIKVFYFLFFKKIIQNS